MTPCYRLNTTEPLEIKTHCHNNGFSLTLHHDGCEGAVAEVYIDYFNDQVQVLIHKLDPDSKKEDSYHMENEPSTKVVLTEDWSNYRPK